MSRNNKYLIFLRAFSVLLVIISCVLIVLFIVNFYGSSFSKSMSDWGEFGSYISCIASLLNLVFFIELTHKATELEKASYTTQTAFQEKTFKQQMLSQKVELQTAFRKSHIDDVRSIMFKLNNLTRYNLKDEENFKEFKRECESLKRVFEIYERNKNVDLIGKCTYLSVNQQFISLIQLFDSVPCDLGLTDEECDIIWRTLNNVNEEIIKLEKQLSDYILEELTKVFNNPSIN